MNSTQKVDQTKPASAKDSNIQLKEECKYEVKISLPSHSKHTKEKNPLKIAIKNLSSTPLRINDIRLGSIYLSVFDMDNLDKARISQVFLSIFFITDFLPRDAKSIIDSKSSIEIIVDLSRLKWSDGLSSSYYLMPYDNIKKGYYFLFVEMEENKTSFKHCSRTQSNQLGYHKE
jgi:hypothetical protein